MQSFKGYKSVTIADNIKRDTALIIYQKLNELPGIYVNLSPIRYYPYNNLGSAVIGYVSSINNSEEERYELMGYDVSTDLIGKAGIESAFEDVLKGVKGGTTVKVNSQGRTTEELFKLESYPGNNVHLTIDRDIQYAAEQALADGIQNIQQNGSDTDGYRFANATRGALVAVEVNTGRILSMVSYPGYDPNLFAVSGQLTSEENRQYFNPDLDTFGEELIKRMKLNKNIDEIFPKDNGIRSDKYDIVYGIDFRFNGKLYRMTMDQMEPDELRSKFEEKLNKKLGKYEVALVEPNGCSDFQFEEYQFIGWYDDIYDLLENCYIDGMKFKDVIMDDNTIIEGKD